MLLTKNVQFQYDSKNRFTLPDIILDAGKELLILGQSGSGKTTLLNILGGLLKPHSGEIIIHDTSLYQLKGSNLDKFRGNHIGIIFQKTHILSALTVKENLQLAAYFGGSKEKEDIDYILRELQILHKSGAKVQTLSEGEAQRVSIARALINRPHIILADEPTSSLDDINTEKVISLLKSQAKMLNAILIVVTHDQRVKSHISNQITVEKNL